jgi:hypothetical protein
MSLIDDIQRDREGGTPGPWHAMRNSVLVYGTVDTFSGRVLGTIATALPAEETDFEGRIWSASGDEAINARRIARVPQLERIALAAHAALERWDSTDWKAASTAEVMNDLRAALRADDQEDAA